jgi:hypothetical protein
MHTPKMFQANLREFVYPRLAVGLSPFWRRGRAELFYGFPWLNLGRDGIRPMLVESCVVEDIARGSLL